MEWLNYHHLFYFWKVVRAGSITRACEELRLAPPTISAQLRSLEDQMGEKLLARSGRSLVPTEMGRVVFRYAEDIFALGLELMDAVKQRPTGKPLRLAIGVDDVLPKEIAHALIEPALRLAESVRILCREASLERLVADLALHELDVVLSDAPVTPQPQLPGVQPRSGGQRGHLGGDSRPWPRPIGAASRRSLDGAPILLPTDDTAIRRDLDQWFAAQGIRPRRRRRVRGLRAPPRVRPAGNGDLSDVPDPREGTEAAATASSASGLAKGVRGRFYAISVEKKVRHPAVAAICESARRSLFAS